ncbi:beta-ketothiolase BktB [Sphingomonas turrisvirgatae]|uniref:Acetyl-CoA acetyltransferase n=1 Tax=Sphingomonas turrisvirgatae TaxID=1888892 RepID=A0A1E3LXJ6_9SPHN|nr:beta-ketothiolase BktB [Sphingomonas turrisvirgatae]ODP38466.1 acetyl-CoA acetyltransferase [Sphingomonas turrisvirgatae]
MQDDIYILSGVRTAIGDFGGALKDVAAAELAAIVFREAISRAQIAPDAVTQVVLGNVIPSMPADAYIARVAAVRAGIPAAASALTVNRLCGSGLQALVSAAQAITLDECDVALAGGAESMSNAPHYVTRARFGQKMGDVGMLDALTRTLSDPFEGYHMGVTAENVALACNISREIQDEAAVESHHRAARAIAEGRFVEQIVPVSVTSRRETTAFEIDEHVRGTTTIEDLRKLRPAFQKDGSVTAGNASGINDGAAALVLASRAGVARASVAPLARIRSWGLAGVEPALMGLGPVEAVPVALSRAGVTLSDIDVIESNEAFAAQACAVGAKLGFDPARTNINGSGISLGHPIGATGAINAVKCIFELKRCGGRFGLVTMCIGGGQGIAMVIENLA